MEIKMLDDFTKWKETLHKVVHISRSVGVKEDTVVNMAQKIGDFLADNVDPENPQQRLIKELWAVGTEEERHTFAHLIVKMVEKEQHTVH
jgi:nuclear transport factor 2 (NTF2) superfamily protein